MHFVRLLVIVFDAVCGIIFDIAFFDVMFDIDDLVVFFANNLSTFLFCTASFCSSFFSLFLIFSAVFPPQAVSSSPPFLIILQKLLTGHNAGSYLLFVCGCFVCGTSGRVKYLLIIFSSTGELCEGGCHSDVDGRSSLGPICSSLVDLAQKYGEPGKNSKKVDH